MLACPQVVYSANLMFGPLLLGTFHSASSGPGIMVAWGVLLPTQQGYSLYRCMDVAIFTSLHMLTAVLPLTMLLAAIFCYWQDTGCWAKAGMPGMPASPLKAGGGGAGSGNLHSGLDGAGASGNLGGVERTRSSALKAEKQVSRSEDGFVALSAQNGLSRSGSGSSHASLGGASAGGSSSGGGGWQLARWHVAALCVLMMLHCVLMNKMWRSFSGLAVVVSPGLGWTVPMVVLWLRAAKATSAASKARAD